MNPHLIIPIGTQIVSLIEIRNNDKEIIAVKGAVGVITKAPTDNSHTYRIRLVSDVEITLHRHQFRIRKQYQKEGLQPDIMADLNLYDYVIYRCLVGSRAFGLDDSQSDTDKRGIYLPPADIHWSLFGIPEQLENSEYQECYWELQKFLILAIKANPNILECLYTPLIETCHPIAQELLAIKEIFLSQLIYQTYNGYVMSQFKKMEQDLRTVGHVRLKHAMHLIRILLSGITILKEGFVPVKVEQYRQQLLAIRYGEMPWEEVNHWRLSLHHQFDEALQTTALPERPNYDKANAFLIQARRSQLEFN